MVNNIIKFMDEEHKEFVLKCCEKANNYDPYHLALFYVLGLTEDCRNNISSLYDWKNGFIKRLNGESYGWITGTDIRIIRLAYNLYNNGCPTAFEIEDVEEKLDETMEYLPTSIFGYLDSEMLEYCFEGIKIRFEKVILLDETLKTSQYDASHALEVALDIICNQESLNHEKLSDGDISCIFNDVVLSMGGTDKDANELIEEYFNFETPSSILKL